MAVTIIGTVATDRIVERPTHTEENSGAIEYFSENADEVAATGKPAINEPKQTKSFERPASASTIATIAGNITSFTRQR